MIDTGKLQLRSGVVVVATWQRGQVHGAGRIVYGSGCEWRGAREGVDSAILYPRPTSTP